MDGLNDCADRGGIPQTFYLVKVFTCSTQDTKFRRDFRGSQRINSTDIGDFSPNNTMRLTLVFLSEMSQQLLDGLP